MGYPKVLSCRREPSNNSTSRVTQNILFNLPCMCWLSNKVLALMEEICVLKKFQLELGNKSEIPLETKTEQSKEIKVLLISWFCPCLAVGFHFMFLSKRNRDLEVL